MCQGQKPLSAGVTMGHNGAAMTSTPAVHRSWTRTYLPPQHGAWAMLIVPFLLGGAASSFGWWSLPLLVVWIDAYLLSFYAFQALKARRLQRYRSPVQLYAVVLVAVGVPLVAVRPWLIVAAVAFLPFAVVNAWYAYRRNDRAVVNGLASVTQACLMVFVAYALGTQAAAGSVPGVATVPEPMALFGICWLYFAGTVFYVKTMIRQAGDRSYYWVSVAFHAIALAIAMLIDPWLALPFAVFLGRAAALPRYRLRPGLVGVIELGNCVLLVVASLATVAR